MPVSTNQAKYGFTQIAVATGILLMVWHWFIHPLSATFQFVFFVVSIFAFGIQHGALDHLVEAEIARRKKATFSIVSFLARYGVLMAVYALFWYLLPQISFLFFILMSGWHFGETDVTNHNNSKLAAAAKLVYGVAVIGWVLFWHTAEASDIISKIIPPQTTTYQVWLAAVNHCILLLFLCGIVITGVLIANGLAYQNSKSVGLLINLLLILACCAGLPLLPAFALYFAGWHSVITLYNINTFTQKETTASQSLPIGKLWLKASPLSGIAIAGLLLIGFLLRHYAPLFQPLPLVFVFLSLITLPHMSIMYQLNKRLFG